MQNDYQQPQRDPELWDLAKRRASFRVHAITYVVINVFLWVLWYVTTDSGNTGGKIPWAIYPTLGWGVGLLFHYLGAFVFERHNRVEDEYNKLLDERKNKPSTKR